MIVLHSKGRPRFELSFNSKIDFNNRFKYENGLQILTRTPLSRANIISRANPLYLRLLIRAHRIERIVYPLEFASTFSLTLVFLTKSPSLDQVHFYRYFSPLHSMAS